MYLTKYNHQNQQQDEGVSVPLPLSRSRGRITNKDDGWNDSDTDSTTTEDSATAGLGINFYDHRGVGRRSVIHSRNNLKEDTQAGDKEGEEGEEAESYENEEEETGYEALQVVSQLSRITNNQIQLHAQPTNGRTPRAQQLQLQQQQQTPSFSSSGGSSSNFNTSQTSTELELQTPKLLAPLQDPDWDHESPLDLINQYLEHNYRQQAESFVRIASRETPVRALSLGLSGSRPGGRAGGSAASASDDHSVLGLGTASTVATLSLPSCGAGAGAVSSTSNDETSLILLEDEKEDHKQSPSFNHHTTSLQLRGSQQSTSTLIRSTSSTSSLSIPVQPLSRIQQASKLSRQRSIASISNSSGFSPLVPLPSPSKSSGTPTTTSTGTFQLRGSGIVRVPIHSKPTIAKRGSRPSSSTSTQTTTTTSARTSKVLRGPEYFTREERLHIARLVHSVARNCERHTNCKDCIDLEYAYYENRFLPRNMDPEQRQKIINNNRSLRNIKNELESLAEHGAISDEVYDTIMSALPAESSLGGSARSNPTPVQAQAPAPAPAPTNAFNNMRLNDPPPPAYTTPAAPSLPNRAPSAPPAKPEIARATALYRYAEPDDCTFEPGDQIAVHEYMNNDWWLGRNLRTGKEGVFPVTYVQIIQPQGPPTMHGAYGNEKAGYNNAYPGQYQPQQQRDNGPPPPGPSNPYNSSVPPMAIAEEPSKPGKGQEMGKKFGKKLGNAAIFGAGATIGGNIVNSIF